MAAMTTLELAPCMCFSEGAADFTKEQQERDMWI